MICCFHNIKLNIGKKSKSTKAGLKNQQKSREAFQCKICMQTFPSTSKAPELQNHITNKHSKNANGRTFAEIFPTYS